MHSLLQSILDTQTVTNGRETYPLTYHMDAAEGRLLQASVRAVQPRVTLEVGMAYGISTLFICEALVELPFQTRHIVIDPFQGSDWHSVGLHNVKTAGYENLVDMHQEASEFVLPRLVGAGVQVQLALIDGWHSFDQALMEFYFINRMLPVGGVVVFDDADRPSVNRVIRYILTYPAFEVFPVHPPAGPSSLLGRLRRRVTAAPWLAKVVHPSLAARDWDLDIAHTCVALRKRAEDRRLDTWFQDF
jgi:predicted O-methyltransferase YrrM